MKKTALLFCISLLLWTGSYAQTTKIAVGHIQTRLGELWIELDDRTPNHKLSFIESISYASTKELFLKY